MITRFAPSPTGPLHLGHTYSAILAYEAAQAVAGTFLLRIEDTDSTRIRPEFEAGIYNDLRWLGLKWDVSRRQSDHYADYWSVLDQLAARGLIFPCACNRRMIRDMGAADGPDGPIYPGTCAHRPMSDATPADAIRLNLSKASAVLPPTLSYIEVGSGTPQTVTFSPETLITDVGAPILRRPQTGDPAYHLACVHDDALQGITHVIRGLDVAPLTQIHVLLQALMTWTSPIYHHHTLITDESGKRLAKIDKSKAIAQFRADGATRQDIRAMVGL